MMMLDDNRNENFYIISTDKKVEAWSFGSIPFEPKGWKKEMKLVLRDRIKQLSPDRGNVLYASYITNSQKFCDVENVLLYNIGAGAFGKHYWPAICIERGYGTVSSPKNTDNIWSYYYKYELHNDVGFVINKPRAVLAEWAGLECDKVVYKPSFFWKYLKQSSVNIFSNNYKGKFGVEVRIKSPHPVKLISIVKPLLDGLISGFHQQDREVEKDVLYTLFRQTAISEVEIQRLLCDASLNILGKRNLVHKFQNGVQWNPADDLCNSIKLVCDDCRGRWKVDGKIFSVE